MESVMQSALLGNRELSGAADFVGEKVCLELNTGDTALEWGN